jgi:hypothetical protein
VVGSEENRFMDMYESELTNIQRKFVEYIKRIQDAQQGRSGPAIDLADRPDLAIGRDNGYPVMPSRPVGIQQTKKDLEVLLRRYLTAHYCK